MTVAMTLQVTIQRLVSKLCCLEGAKSHSVTSIQWPSIFFRDWQSPHNRLCLLGRHDDCMLALVMAVPPFDLM